MSKRRLQRLYRKCHLLSKEPVVLSMTNGLAAVCGEPLCIRHRNLVHGQLGRRQHLRFILNEYPKLSVCIHEDLLVMLGLDESPGVVGLDRVFPVASIDEDDKLNR